MYIITFLNIFIKINDFNKHKSTDMNIKWNRMINVARFPYVVSNGLKKIINEKLYISFVFLLIALITFWKSDLPKNIDSV